VKRRAVFLDRDGVLIEPIVRDNRAFAPLSFDELRLAAGAGVEVGRLREAGLIPIVFTNQPEVGRGLLATETLTTMHEWLRAAVPVEDIFVCPHDDLDGCDCRKPKPGMLHAASAKWEIDLGASFVVGDRSSDIEAGRAVGCYTILLERPYSGESVADSRVIDLSAAVDLILARTGKDTLTPTGRLTVTGRRG
jgi:D-glycero-D-manno-heptose 1,7-bisphosphate phosphatase